MDKLKTVLNDLGITGSAQRIYLSLLADGEATAHVLSKRTSITRPSVYDQIKELRSKDLIAERNIEGKTYFVASDVRRLNILMEEKIKRFEDGREILNETL